MKKEVVTDNGKAKSKDRQLVDERREQIVNVAIKLFSELGFYRTTIEKIAKAGNFSQGLIYRYFDDKEELLVYALSVVLDAYETEIPAKLTGINHPIDHLCAAITAFCTSVDRHRQATVLAYRSTKSLPFEKRKPIKAAEEKTNRYLRAGVESCIEEGYMSEVDVHLLVYQYLMFAHSWALKNWAFKQRYTIEDYVGGGLKLLVKPFLTPKGLEYWRKYYEKT